MEVLEAHLFEFHKLCGMSPQLALRIDVQCRLRRVDAASALEEPSGGSSERRRCHEIGEGFGGARGRARYEARPKTNRTGRLTPQPRAGQATMGCVGPDTP